MTDNRKAGLALIAGTLGGLVTMAVHPTSHSSHLAYSSGAVHSLAFVSFLALFLGTCVLTRLLNGPDRLAFVALVVFGFALVAGLTAGAVSGFIVPDILRLMAKAEPSAEPSAERMWRITVAAIAQINQAMSRIYAVATSLAILLWSVTSLRQGRLSRLLAIYGCLIPPLVALLIIAGHLRMDVHGFTVVVVSQGIWFFATGVVLLRSERVGSPESRVPREN